MSRRRPGKTETGNVSVDTPTKARPKKAAERWYGSRRFTPVAQRLAADAAFETAWTWYGGPLPTPDETTVTDEWIDRLLRKAKRKAARGRRAA